MATVKASQKSPLEKAIKGLETALSTEFEMNAGILRQGDRVIIPETATYRGVAEALLRHEITHVLVDEAAGFRHSAPVEALLDVGLAGRVDGPGRQVDHVLVASRIVVGGVRTILIPQQTPGTFILR